MFKCGALIVLSVVPCVVAAQDVASCVAGLDAPARLVYDDTVSALVAESDLKAVLTEHTKALVSAGKLSRSVARGAATAAAECLKLGQS